MSESTMVKDVIGGGKWLSEWWRLFNGGRVGEDGVMVDGNRVRFF